MIIIVTFGKGPIKTVSQLIAKYVEGITIGTFRKKKRKKF